MDYNEFISKYDIRLSRRQSEAVREASGPLLLLAVPGSGKTATLTARLGYMIYCRKIKPESILTITYTRAATMDMKRRFAKIFGSEHAEAVNFKTINALCVDILRIYTKYSGGKIFDVADNNNMLLRELYTENYGEFPAESDLLEIKTKLSYIKNMMLSEKEIDEMKTSDGKSLSGIYDAYIREMRCRGRMDYDDQLVYARRALFYDKIAGEVRQKYSHLLVDEAQDTSRIQHDIIRRIAGNSDDLFMVGDEDQSIYGFRAAFPEALMKFEKIYSRGRVMFLEDNYRSSKEIIKKAQHLIRHNSGRRDKNMNAMRRSAGSVVLKELYGRNTQYKYIAAYIKNNDIGNTALLFRNNDSILPYVLQFEEQHIEYSLKMRDCVFFKSKTVADAKNILRFALDMRDMDIFMSVYSKLGCYLKKSEAEQAVYLFGNGGFPDIWTALIHVAGKNRKRIEDVKEHLEQIASVGNSKAALRILSFNIFPGGSSGGYEEKLFIMRALAADGESLGEYLSKLKRLELIAEEGRCGSKNLILSTIHLSKGLEYDNVIIADAIDGIFPAGTHDSQECDMEEERRLFYVAMTRARDSLMILDYKGECQPFLQELSPAEKTVGHTLRHMRSGNQPGMHFGKIVPSEKKFSDAAEDVSELMPGVRVEHGDFGSGIINTVKGNILEIEFSDGTKRLSAAICIEKGLLRVTV